MNVLALLQTTANRLGIPSPSAYTSNTQLLNLLYQVNEELRNRKCFPQQKRTQTVTLVAGTYEYALAADYYSGLIATQFDQTQSGALIGPLNDSEFNYRLYGVGAPGGADNAFRIFGPTAVQITTSKMLKFDSTNFTAGTISFDYISGSTFYTAAGSLTTTLKETAAADTDIPMFDDDILISGLKAAYKEAKGLDYAFDRQQFEKLVDAAETRFKGSFKGSLYGAPQARSAHYRNGTLYYSFGD